MSKGGVVRGDVQNPGVCPCLSWGLSQQDVPGENNAQLCQFNDFLTFLAC